MSLAIEVLRVRLHSAFPHACCGVLLGLRLAAAVTFRPGIVCPLVLSEPVIGAVNVHSAGHLRRIAFGTSDQLLRRRLAISDDLVEESQRVGLVVSAWVGSPELFKSRRAVRRA